VVEEPLVAPILRSPLLPAAQRRELVQTLARELPLSDLVTRFLGLVADQQRLGELQAIRDRFDQLLDQELGRVRATIRTAMPLEATQHREVVAAFAALTGKQVMPSTVVDNNLLGGVIVEIEGKVYDGSVRTQLDRLARQLSGTASF
jgi:F-type H+-transporting ATPase subunit delta